MHTKQLAVLPILIIGLAGFTVRPIPSLGASSANIIEPPTATVVPDATLYVWRVYVRTPADEATLLSGEWDVLESRGPDYLRVLGDDVAGQALRTHGFRVAVDEVIAAGSARSPLTYFYGYHTILEHEQHLDSATSTHPDLAVRINYGTSWRQQHGVANGHPLSALCITHLRPGDCVASSRTDKARFLLIAGVHARELVPPELAWRWIDYLLANYGVDPEITTLLDYNELWVVPVANPDGRSILEQGGNSPLMQRKNADTSYGACSIPNIGVDLNRNAAFKWGVTGASTVACNELYKGPTADSEPETVAMENLEQALFADQRGPAITEAAPLTTTGLVLNLHSDGNLSMLPWDWTNAHSPNDAQLRAIAFRFSYFNGYLTGQSWEVLYPCSGTWEDWVYGQLGLPSMLFEIGSSFMPNYSLVDSSYWPLNRDALLYAAKIARQPYTQALGPTTVSPTLGQPSIMATQPVTLSAWIDDQRYGTSGYGRPTPRAVAQAEYYIDTPPWAGGTSHSIAPVDGAFNSTREQATGVIPGAVTAGLAPGRHTLWIRGRGVNGNWGPTTAVWLMVTPLPYAAYVSMVFDEIATR